MKPIRLDEAIDGAKEALGHYHHLSDHECAEIESQSELAVLRRIESGAIVTPADEALARMNTVIRRPGQYLHECIACRSTSSDIGFKLGTAHREGCPAVMAKRKVAALEDQ